MSKKRKHDGNPNDNEPANKKRRTEDPNNNIDSSNLSWVQGVPKPVLKTVEILKENCNAVRPNRESIFSKQTISKVKERAILRIIDSLAKESSKKLKTKFERVKHVVEDMIVNSHTELFVIGESDSTHSISANFHCIAIRKLEHRKQECFDAIFLEFNVSSKTSKSGFSFGGVLFSAAVGTMIVGGPLGWIVGGVLAGIGLGTMKKSIPSEVQKDTSEMMKALFIKELLDQRIGILKNEDLYLVYRD